MAVLGDLEELTSVPLAAELYVNTGVGADYRVSKNNFLKDIDKYSAETLESTVTDGTAPLTVVSTTVVDNLNVDQVDGADVSTDGTLASNSDVLIPTQKAVKTYADDLYIKNLSAKNYVINGNFNMAQRGTSAYTSAGYGNADRWYTNTVGNTFSTSYESFANTDTLYATYGATNYIKCAVTSVAGAGNYTVILQRMEDVTQLAGKTITVSFWAKADSGTPKIGCEIAQNFGSGGSPSSVVTGTGQAITLSTTWTKYSLTFAVPSLSGKTLGITANTNYTGFTFWLDAGATYNTRTGSIGQASKTVSIAQVMLNEGSVALPFAYYGGSKIADEMACRRYYNRLERYPNDGYQYGTTGTLRQGFVYSFPVVMRASPTVATVTAPTYVGCTESASHSASAYTYVHRVELASVIAYRVNGGVFSFAAEL